MKYAINGGIAGWAMACGGIHVTMWEWWIVNACIGAALIFGLME